MAGPIVTAWRQRAGEYLRESSRPLAALAFILPLLALYELGVIILGPQAVRNGADVWLRQLLDGLGLGQYFLLPVLTVGGLLGWHYVARHRWELSVSTLVIMAGECVGLAFLLLVLARGEAALFEAALRDPTAAAIPAAMPWVLSARAAVVGRVVGFLGAGVYEEALFRMLLVPPVTGAASRLGVRGGIGVACAVIITSIGFSAAHYLGAHGEAFQTFSFAFRCTAGAFFALLFIHRGFGIAAGTHAIYDILAGFA